MPAGGGMATLARRSTRTCACASAAKPTPRRRRGDEPRGQPRNEVEVVADGPDADTAVQTIAAARQRARQPGAAVAPPAAAPSEPAKVDRSRGRRRRTGRARRRDVGRCRHPDASCSCAGRVKSRARQHAGRRACAPGVGDRGPRRSEEIARVYAAKRTTARRRFSAHMRNSRRPRTARRRGAWHGRRAVCGVRVACGGPSARGLRRG